MSRNYKVIILVAVAAILGYAILNQQKSTPTSSTSPISDERFILNPPSASSSAELKKKHADTVVKLAKTAPYLEITDCKPNILVLRVKQGSQLEIRNNDAAAHQLTFDEENSLNIGANDKATINVNFKYGTGDYGYVCKGLGLVGFLHIVP